MEKLLPPWTDEQVDALNRYQRKGRMHPFTCGQPQHRISPALVATTQGWICPDPLCGYTQDWAHGFMADPALLTPALTELRFAANPNLRRTSTSDAIAYRIRAELVCCDIYDRITRKELTIRQAKARGEWHDICYYGEWSAQLAEGRCPGYETDPNICRCECEGCQHNCSAHQQH